MSLPVCEILYLAIIQWPSLNSRMARVYYCTLCVFCNSSSFSIPEDATEAIYEQPPDHDDSSSDDSDPYSKIDADLSPQHLFGMLHIASLSPSSLPLSFSLANEADLNPWPNTMLDIGFCNVMSVVPDCLYN